MMEEVILEGEVEGGGGHKEKEGEEEEQDRLSGSILKDNSIVLFEAGEENEDKDLMGSAPDLEEDPALIIAPVTTLKSTTFKQQEEDLPKGVDGGVNIDGTIQPSKGVDGGVDQDCTIEPADTVVQLLSKQVTEKTIDDEEMSKVEEEGGKNEAEDQKLVIELLRQQVASTIPSLGGRGVNI